MTIYRLLDAWNAWGARLADDVAARATEIRRDAGQGPEGQQRHALEVRYSEALRPFVELRYELNSTMAEFFRLWLEADA